jgi:hypothetical protein
MSRWPQMGWLKWVGRSMLDHTPYRKGTRQLRNILLFSESTQAPPKDDLRLFRNVDKQLPPVALMLRYG